MVQPILSILGMYEYDNTVFDNMYLPDGVNSEDVKMSIFAECAELCLVYPALTTMKQLIGTWSRSHKYEWDTLYASTQLEYDPIENYNRKEEWHEENSVGKEHSMNSSNKIDSTGTGNATQVTESETSGSADFQNKGNQTTTESQGAFNVSGLQDAVKSIVAMGDGQDSSSTSKTDGNLTLSNTTQMGQTGSETETGQETEKGTNHRTGRAHGNIGVTTTQQMLEQERNIAMFNIVEHIALQFRDKFCVCVY